MPIIRSSSDLQRKFGAIDALAHDTREPIYITRNGEASLVLMDSAAFDEQLDLQRRIYEREMRAYEAILESEQDFAEGRGMTLDEVRALRMEANVPKEVA